MSGCRCASGQTARAHRAAVDRPCEAEAQQHDRQLEPVHARRRARLSTAREKSIGASMDCEFSRAARIAAKNAVAAVHVRQQLERRRRCRARCPRARARRCASPCAKLRMRGEEALDDRARSPRAARCTSRRRGARPASRASRRTRGCEPASRPARATRRLGCRHLRSGLRRSVPKPVHGASTSTRSILPARRFTFVSRSFAMHCGCTFDSPERARRGVELREALCRSRRMRRGVPASA